MTNNAQMELSADGITT